MWFSRAVAVGFVAATCSSVAVARPADVSLPVEPASSRSRHAAAPLAGPAGDPLEELRRTDVTLEAALRRRVPDWSPEADVARMREDAILAGILDYERIAKAALGPSWARLTEEQRRSFLRRFAALTNQAFVSALIRWEARVRFDSETILGPTASVLVTATAEAAEPRHEQRIEYRLGLRQGRWLIYDVLVDDVSLVEGYRTQFASLMRRGGFEEIMSRMQRKLDASSRQ